MRAHFDWFMLALTTFTPFQVLLALFPMRSPFIATFGHVNLDVCVYFGIGRVVAQLVCDFFLLNLNVLLRLVMWDNSWLRVCHNLISFIFTSWIFLILLEFVTLNQRRCCWCIVWVSMLLILRLLIKHSSLISCRTQWPIYVCSCWLNNLLYTHCVRRH